VADVGGMQLYELTTTELINIVLAN